MHLSGRLLYPTPNIYTFKYPFTKTYLMYRKLPFTDNYRINSGHSNFNEA